MGDTFKLFVNFEMETCVVCGVPMILPQDLLSDRRRLGGYIYCPKGHKTHWRKPLTGPTTEELKAEVARLKREQVQAIHDADQQAAAKEAGKVIQPAESKEPAESIAADILHVRGIEDLERFRVDDNLYQCPCCDKRYRTTMFFYSHYMKKHGAAAPASEGSAK